MSHSDELFASLCNVSDEVHYAIKNVRSPINPQDSHEVEQYNMQMYSHKR